MSPEILLSATLETIYMVLISSFFACLLGIPWGIILFSCREDQILAHKHVYRILSFVTNSLRSIPFIILLVAIIPLTRFLTGSSIGTSAAIVPLSIAAIPFLARLIEGALLEVEYGLIEAALAMGANPRQIIFQVLCKEALPGFINAITVMMVNLVSYSAMAGIVVGGGLGNLAIRFGYQRFDAEVMLVTILILILMVQGIQGIGDFLFNKKRHKI